MMKTSVIPVEDLSGAHKSQMQDLLSRYFAHAGREAFLRDLGKKRWVVVAFARQRVVGFSTQVLWHVPLGAETVRVLFSGDTVVETAYRSSVALPFAVARLMTDLYDRDSESPLYWLLTSKGHKTYRALRVFFRHYFPAPHLQPTDRDYQILRRVMTAHFEGRMDAENWILRAAGRQQRLRSEFAQIERSKRNHPDVTYFLARNPGYVRGDELVCLARFAPDNIHPRIWHKLERVC